MRVEPMAGGPSTLYGTGPSILVRESFPRVEPCVPPAFGRKDGLPRKRPESQADGGGGAAAGTFAELLWNAYASRSGPGE
jgi:hypothetical protein